MKSLSKIFSINAGHDASVVYMEDGNVSWMIEEERYSHKKHDEKAYFCISNASNRIDQESVVLLTMLHHPDTLDKSKHVEDVTNVLCCKALKKATIGYKNCSDEHHLQHAATGFYNSGFDEAVCVVVDGAGAFVNDCGHEVESIYTASYPDQFHLVSQKAVPWYSKVDSHTLKNPTSGIGFIYAGISEYLGFGLLGSGTVMGLAPYGEEDPEVKPFIVNGEIDESLFERTGTGVRFKPYGPFPMQCPIFDSVRDPRVRHQKLCNLAYRLQKDFEIYMVGVIKRAIELTGCKNVVLSGGCALNCVGNYEYLKHLPEGSKLFVEPICYDAGTSLGLAMLEWRMASKSMEKKPLEHLYLGPPQRHYVPDGAYDVSLSDVVDVIDRGEAVAIFQGRSEQGPRALGNRSLLFDPRVENAREIMNDIKGRELFRPFAASVMKEHADVFFDMRGLEESPFMMYAMDAYEEHWDTIPGVLHVDKTCRIQTVTREQNQNYYDLIDAFYERTGIPMLLNTSLNLSGDTICETVDDAIATLKRSKINYLYLPECGKMVHIPENSNANRRGKIYYGLYRA